MQDRLIEKRVWWKVRRHPVHLKSQPARSTRRIIKAHEWGTQASSVVFTTVTPGVSAFYASVAYAPSRAHIFRVHGNTCRQVHRHAGIGYRGVRAFHGQAHDQDIKALERRLTDPRFDTPYWKEQINLMLKIRQEGLNQQAFAGRGWIMWRISICRRGWPEMGLIWIFENKIERFWNI